MSAVTKAADLLVAQPWRVQMLRAAHRLRTHRPDGPARAFENHIKDAIARRGSEVVTVPIQGGGTMAVDLGDYFHQKIAATGRYEPSITDLFATIVKPGDVFFDVGANAGYYSAQAASQGATVHAFEPNPAMIDLIKRTASPNATLVEVAIGDEIGEVTFHLSPDPSHSGIASIEALPELAGGAELTVPITTLDAYCTNVGVWPDVMKIDVESHEAAVIAGMQSLLSDHAPRHIVVELRRIPGVEDPAGTAQTIIDAGYTASVLRDNETALPYSPVLLDRFDNVHFARN